ncbi:carbohydrate ABC transporter permease [Falsihalocynthiibacter sp. SS001]|uniref:carbohydrate ABC transporter permease n=1 Tax=Falsihalocynthiibacter sp. SS001 TaxID=3349698 RepID=UPI0036D30F29
MSDAAIDYEAIIAAQHKKPTKGKGLLIIGFLVSLIWLIPFYYLMVSVFKSTPEYAASHPLALPQGVAPIVDNVLAAWSQAKMGQGFVNSILYGTVGATLAILFAAMAAFGLSRFEFKNKNLWFLVIFSGTLFPFQMFLIPLFFMYQDWGILNTRLGMCLFYTAVCIPFPTLVLRNFMNSIPKDVDLAARIDGATEFQVFLRIILPNTIGPLTAVFLIQFTWIWNDLLFSTVLGNSVEVRSIMNSLQVFQGSYSSAGENIILTGALLASIPTVLLFVVLRKHFMEGMKIQSM